MWRSGALLCLGLGLAGPVSARVVADFDNAHGWRLQVSEGAVGRVQSTAGAEGGRGQCLQLDFGAYAGSAQFTAPLALTLPADARLSLASKGQGGHAQLALELIDDQGRRFGSHQAGRALGTRWQSRTWALSDFTDASGAALRLPAQVRQVRLRVASARGGVVQWCVDNRRLLAEPEDASPMTAVALADTATALQQRMADGRTDTFWVSTGVKQQTVSLDLGRPREVGGLVVQWAAGMRASRYNVQGSLDGRRWQALRQVDGAAGTVDRLRLGPLQARYLRLDLEDGPNWRYGIVDLTAQPAAFGRSLQAWLDEIGRHLPAGVLPASVQGAPQAWTVLSAGDAPAPAWFSAQGIVEPAPGLYTLAPQLQVDGSWYGAQELQASPQAVAGGARTVLDHGQARLDVLATPGTDEAGRAWLRLRYRLHNPDRNPHRYALALAARPFQIHPAGRYGDLPGGAGWLETVEVQAGNLLANGQLALVAGQAPEAAFASHFDAGLDLALLRGARWPESRQARDAQGLASAVMVWRAQLAAGEHHEWQAWVPLSPGMPANTSAPLGFQARSLAGEGLLLPGVQGRQLGAAWSAAVQRMRDERNGPWLRVDSRRVVGAGNRDGQAMAAALLRADQTDAVVPWLLARIRAGSTATCAGLVGWTEMAAVLQAASAWPPAALQALAQWRERALERVSPEAVCAQELPGRAGPAALTLAGLQWPPLPVIADTAPSTPELPAVLPDTGQDAGTDFVPVEAGPLPAPAGVAQLPGQAIGKAGREQRWQAALALSESDLPPGWQRWVRGQSAGLADARQAADQVAAIAAVLVDEGEDYLQLLPGVPASAWSAGVLQVPALLTRWGRLGLAARREGQQWVVQLAPGLQLPPSGLVLEWPYDQAPGEVLVDGVPGQWQDGRLHLTTLPTELRITLPHGH